MQTVITIITIVIFFSISGCSGIRQINQNAGNVSLFFNYPTQNCRFLGIIKNPSVHEDMDVRSSIKDLNKDDSIFLKNAGAKIGANVVVLVAHKSKIYHKRYIRGSTNLTSIFTHSVIAKAYDCPSLKNDQPDQNYLEIKQTPLFENDDIEINS